MTVSVDDLRLKSKTVGALPIINHFLSMLNLREILRKWLPSETTLDVPAEDMILLLVRNILLMEKRPLYEIPEWVLTLDTNLLGLKDLNPSKINDDRIGRSLNILFEADRSSAQTELVLHAISEFNVDIKQFHNDSTTLTFSGKYDDCEKSYKGKSVAKIVHGHNKDHRPDLKQILFTLTVTRDGAVPIHFKTYDGNVTDDRTHIQTWESLRRLTGYSGFTYVADSKLCTREQMEYINKEDGKFITILPKTRSEDKWFREWCQTHLISWQEILRKPDHRRPESSEHIYWGIESPLPSEEGYRIIWISSSQKRDQDVYSRQKKIKKTIEGLDRLKQKVGRGKLKTKMQIEEAIKALLEVNKCQEYFKWHIVSQEKTEYKQNGRGRPGENTDFSKVVTYKNSFVAFPDNAVIQNKATTDGFFPIITNISKENLSMQDVLLAYKYQPYIEKRHENYKTVFEATPVYLKAAHRIEAMQFVNFIVLLLSALIERQLRTAMTKEKIISLPLYPESRNCKAPSTQRILSLFANQRKHILTSKANPIKTFTDPLSDLQIQVLDLLKIPVSEYQNEALR